MNENKTTSRNNKIINDSAAQITQLNPINDLHNLGQYVVDRGIEAFGKAVNSLEQEKPGATRKLTGITLLAAGVGGVGAGLYFLTM